MSVKVLENSHGSPTTTLICDECNAGATIYEHPYSPTAILPPNWGKRLAPLSDRKIKEDDLCPQCFSIYKELKYGMPDYGMTEKRFKEVCETKEFPKIDFKFHNDAIGKIASEMAQKMAEEQLALVREAVEAHVWRHLATEDLLTMRDRAADELKKRGVEG